MSCRAELPKFLLESTLSHQTSKNLSGLLHALVILIHKTAVKPHFYYLIKCYHDQTSVILLTKYFEPPNCFLPLKNANLLSIYHPWKSRRPLLLIIFLITSLSAFPFIISGSHSFFLFYFIISKIDVNSFHFKPAKVMPDRLVFFIKSWLPVFS